MQNSGPSSATDETLTQYIDMSYHHENEGQSDALIYVTDTDLEEHPQDPSLLEILLAGGASPLSPLPRDESLKYMDPTMVIQRLIWTPIIEWNNLKKLRKYNAGLRIAFSPNNAVRICNFIIKNRYAEEAEYLGLDTAAPLSSAWLTPRGPQVHTIRDCEKKFWEEIIKLLGLWNDNHLYRPSLSFLTPGPALLYGLESGMVLVKKDPATGHVIKGLRCDVVQKCLHALTEPWYVSTRGCAMIPRSELGAITWYYDQDGGRENAVKALDDILAQAEPRESFNFEDESLWYTGKP